MPRVAVIERCLDTSVFEMPVDAALNVCAQVSCTQFLSMSLLIVVTVAICMDVKSQVVDGSDNIDNIPSH
jgi:hypothetical protein